MKFPVREHDTCSMKINYNYTDPFVSSRRSVREVVVKEHWSKSFATHPYDEWFLPEAYAGFTTDFGKILNILI